MEVATSHKLLTLLTLFIPSTQLKRSGINANTYFYMGGAAKKI